MSKGIDYAYGPLDYTAASNDGLKFVCRYLSTPGNPKNLTKTELVSLSQANIFVVMNFETTGVSYRGGQGAGEDDGRLALAAADEFGAPDNRPVIFSIDTDLQSSEFGLLDAYSQGIANVLTPARSGIYGSYSVITHVQQLTTIQWYWQTYAWSNHAIAQNIHLYQYLNNQNLYGVNCDLDESLQPDFGGWNLNVQPPKPKGEPMPFLVQDPRSQGYWSIDNSLEHKTAITDTVVFQTLKFFGAVQINNWPDTQIDAIPS